jgi:nucleotide-binding universal stress UspA family protein
MKTILFPTDFSRNAVHALDFAMLLAKAIQARIVLLHAFYAVNAFDESYASLYSGDVIGKLEEAAHENMGKLTADINKRFAWATLESRIEPGYAETKIPEVAESIKADFIVMGTTGANNAIDKMIGSTALKVVKHATCPVLVIPEKARLHEFKSVLYAAELGKSENQTVQKILDFASVFQADIRVIHIENAEKPNPETNELMKNLKKTFRNDNITFRNIVRKDLFSGLEKYIHNHKPDVLAISRKTRGFWESILHKSVTRHFALTTHIPLLVLQNAE